MLKDLKFWTFNKGKINSDQSYESVKIQLINILIYLNSYIWFLILIAWTFHSIFSCQLLKIFKILTPNIILMTILKFYNNQTIFFYRKISHYKKNLKNSSNGKRVFYETKPSQKTLPKELVTLKSLRKENIVQEELT